MGIYYITVGFSFMLMTILFPCATSATDKDKEECTKQLVGLATCLPYVGGSAKAPTPDCCSGLKQVLKSNKKCLCVIVKDRNDPDLGLSINVTLALGLPTVCHAPANISECPALLHLAPNSTEAQIFYQFGQGSNSSAGSPVDGVTANSSSMGTSSPQKSSGCCSGKRWLGLEIFVGSVLLCSFTSHLLI